MLQSTLLLIEQIAQRVVDQAQGDRNVALRGAMLLRQALDQVANLGPGLRPVFLQFTKALRRVDAALEVAGPPRRLSTGSSFSAAVGQRQLQRIVASAKTARREGP
jgi:hypothetical protein